MSVQKFGRRLRVMPLLVVLVSGMSLANADDPTQRKRDGGADARRAVQQLPAIRFINSSARILARGPGIRPAIVDTVPGAPCTPATNGSSGDPGEDGTAGGAGGDASASANASDSSNTATANGANGCRGGNGGTGTPGTANGGNGGNGGDGGDADATAETTIASGNGSATATANGGDAGAGDTGGSAPGGGTPGWAVTEVRVVTPWHQPSLRTAAMGLPRLVPRQTAGTAASVAA